MEVQKSFLWCKNYVIMMRIIVKTIADFAPLIFILMQISQKIMKTSWKKDKLRLAPQQKRKVRLLLWHLTDL